MRVLWDGPLLFGIFVGNLFGIRLLDDGKGNFISVIDDNIVMSSMPLPSDVAEMKRHNVKFVVNMQAEWSGPQASYRQAGIKQLVRPSLTPFTRSAFISVQQNLNIPWQWLPTLDMSCPSKEDLHKGVAFIRQSLEQTKAEGGRVLIHCKGGRGRATTMAVAYFAATGEDPNTSFERIKAVRPVAEPKVLSYLPLLEFVKEITERV